ncbi:3D domain-containing protein [Candidatus Uhrbacteria bacterium]|nr:3D domain-containing protein [Candidatus Uhrbacteria bacterium]
MRFARISKKHVFPIIISILVQFHLPQASLLAVSAAGSTAAGPMVFAVRIDQNRTVPYRDDVFAVREGARRARLLGLNKKQSPVAKSNSPRTTKTVITAYSSTRDQTDATPCITANGFNVCAHNTENVIAANFLPFGTRVTIPELFGDKEFVVQDRMNTRYSNRVDVWMTSRTRAKQFGVKRAHIVVLHNQQKTITQPSETQVAVNF